MNAPSNRPGPSPATLLALALVARGASLRTAAGLAGIALSTLVRARARQSDPVPLRRGRRSSAASQPAPGPQERP
jgi:hypothetical protein